MSRDSAFVVLAVSALAAMMSIWLPSAPIADAPDVRAALAAPAAAPAHDVHLAIAAPGPPPVSAAPPAVAATTADEDSDAATIEIDPDELHVLVFLRNNRTGLAEAELARLAEVIVREARANHLEPELVLGLIRVESGGYNFAVSGVGAHGLMQLMPPTGHELALQAGIEWHGAGTLFDPFVNVKLGTRYLRQLSERYNGNIPKVLAAYNWGPGAIDRRLRRGKSLPTRYAQQVKDARERNLALASRS